MDASEQHAALESAAEIADEDYLRALDETDGNASDEVLRRFAIARALAAMLLATLATRDSDQESTLEGAYELCVISPMEEEGLRLDIAAALTT